MHFFRAENFTGRFGSLTQKRAAVFVTIYQYETGGKTLKRENQRGKMNNWKEFIRRTARFRRRSNWGYDKKYYL